MGPSPDATELHRPVATAAVDGSSRGHEHRCRHCERSFTKIDHLARHERSHVGWKPFVCEVCSRSFGRRDSLVRHARLHVREKTRRAQTSPALQMQDIVEEGEAQDTTDQASTVSDTQQSSETAVSHAVVETPPSIFDPTTSLSSSIGSHSINQEFLQWPESQDLLQVLMSDTAAWPVALPMMQFSPVGPEIIGQDVCTGLATREQSTSTRVRGHQAVHNLTMLVTELAKNISGDIETTGITADFLDVCFSMFWTRFIPSFPILHRSAFVTEECAHPLLLNIVAIGSLFVGTREAAAKGEALWRLAHAAVATSWQDMMEGCAPQDDCSGVQLVTTALLGQTYAMLSKNKLIRTTSQIFHGLGYYWGRHCSMSTFDPAINFTVPSLNDSFEVKHKKWQTWLATEIRKRVVLAHYILDGLIAQASGNATFARHVTNPIPLPVDENVFVAKSVDDWITQMQSYRPTALTFREVYVSLFNKPFAGPLQSFSRFSIWVILEGVQSLVSDNHEALQYSLGTPTLQETQQALFTLYHEHMASPLTQLSPLDLRDAMLRWHSINIQTVVNTKYLTLQICQDYNIPQDLLRGTSSSLVRVDLNAWTRSSEGRRALLHAMSILDIVEQLPFMRTHAIHIPSAVFTAVTILTAFLIACPSIALPPRPLDWTQILQDDGNGVWGQYISGSDTASPSKGVLDSLSFLQVFLASISTVCLIARDMNAVVLRWLEIR